MLVICIWGTPLYFHIPKLCIELARATRDFSVTDISEEKKGDRAILWQPEYFLNSLLLIVMDDVYSARGSCNRVLWWILILFLAICNCHLRYCMCFTFLSAFSTRSKITYFVQIKNDKKIHGTGGRGEERSGGTRVPFCGCPEKRREKKPKGNTLGPCHGGFGLKFWSIIVGCVL